MLVLDMAAIRGLRSVRRSEKVLCARAPVAARDVTAAMLMPRSKLCGGEGGGEVPECYQEPPTGAPETMAEGLGSQVAPDGAAPETATGYSTTASVAVATNDEPLPPRAGAAALVSGAEPIQLPADAAIPLGPEPIQSQDDDDAALALDVKPIQSDADAALAIEVEQIQSQADAARADDVTDEPSPLQTDQALAIQADPLPSQADATLTPEAAAEPIPSPACEESTSIDFMGVDGWMAQPSTQPVGDGTALDLEPVALEEGVPTAEQPQLLLYSSVYLVNGKRPMARAFVLGRYRRGGKSKLADKQISTPILQLFQTLWCSGT